MRYGQLILLLQLVGQLGSFVSCSGSVGTEQSFTLSGSDLTADITVTAPTGYEFSPKHQVEHLVVVLLLVRLLEQLHPHQFLLG